MSRESGRKKIIWAARQMPVLTLLAERFKTNPPLVGVRVAACLHVTAETANLARVLKSGGADLSLCASNPLSTQDDIAQSLRSDYKIKVYAKRGVNSKEYYKNIAECLASKPNLTVDDGADLVTQVHSKNKRLLKNIWGGTEETTTGVVRLRALAKSGKLKYPIVAVNDALSKHLFDNQYGTGQSTIDGILRATNILLAGKVAVVAGYGWCGRGVALRLKGMGCRVIISEVNATKALEAIMDGYQVMPLIKAASLGELFITCTGNIDVITRDHFKLMPDGAILVNAGHFDVEINVKDLDRLTGQKTLVRHELTEYKLKNGKALYLVAEGRLVNLSAAEGHPAAVMDLSFANQALSLEYLVKHQGLLKPAVYPVPAEIDKEIAQLKLKALGVSIDTLTPKQAKYLSSWQTGT